ncbi:MAG: hypothetical protein US50_C0005G0023 [Candidatus Nomurabacteria bacterium GW2011_GWB1_37_5]|uniref:Uncharacterized protein n=1 Tax=Candidatus Nomurabacteria bacterium GW2011_GWB1_37_5 TaxID=1618742 RepID=A0A0G0H0Q8_9BACT|nr:MAG: hypothetical protein US50_C0005G0023 [Candidatus Nomurabacteria bacterium GW2011_GWB1_37_5]
MFTNINDGLQVYKNEVVSYLSFFNSLNGHMPGLGSPDYLKMIQLNNNINDTVNKYSLTANETKVIDKELGINN